MRSVRLPFAFGQHVRHPDWPDLTFRVLTQTAIDGDDWDIAVTDVNGGGWWSFSAWDLTPEFNDLQAEMADWLGTSVEQMNKDHDALHRRFCDAFGLRSLSMDVAEGRPLSEAQKAVASLEEQAVLHTQRLLYAYRRLEGGRAD